MKLRLSCVRLWSARITGMQLHTGSEHPTLSFSEGEFQGGLEFTATPLLRLPQCSESGVVLIQPHRAAPWSSGSLSMGSQVM